MVSYELAKGAEVMSVPPLEYQTGPENYKTLNFRGRTKRFMSLAKKVAHNCEAEDYKHGAVLVKGGKVINTAFNKNSYCSFGCRFRNEQPGTPTVHAELGAVLGISRSVTTGSTLYVCRIGKRGDYRLSKPCPMCYAALKHVGVRRVVWTINNKECGTYKL